MCDTYCLWGDVFTWIHMCHLKNINQKAFFIDFVLLCLGKQNSLMSVLWWRYVGSSKVQSFVLDVLQWRWEPNLIINLSKWDRNKVLRTGSVHVYMCRNVLKPYFSPDLCPLLILKRPLQALKGRELWLSMEYSTSDITKIEQVVSTWLSWQIYKWIRKQAELIIQEIQAAQKHELICISWKLLFKNCVQHSFQ